MFETQQAVKHLMERKANNIMCRRCAEIFEYVKDFEQHIEDAEMDTGLLHDNGYILLEEL